MNPRNMPIYGEWDRGESLAEERARQFATMRGIRYHKSMIYPGEVNSRNKKRIAQKRRKK